MNIEEYRSVRNKMYAKYPSGLGFKDMENPEDLWKILSKKTLPKNFDPLFLLYRINIEATKKRLASHKIALAKLHNKLYLLGKMCKTPPIRSKTERTNEKISQLYDLINEAKENIKTSEYGLTNMKRLSQSP